jgi:hypothetical protein
VPDAFFGDLLQTGFNGLVEGGGDAYIKASPNEGKSQWFPGYFG